MRCSELRVVDGVELRAVRRHDQMLSHAVDLDPTVRHNCGRASRKRELQHRMRVHIQFHELVAANPQKHQLAHATKWKVQLRALHVRNALIRGFELQQVVALGRLDLSIADGVRVRNPEAHVVQRNLIGVWVLRFFTFFRCRSRRGWVCNHKSNPLKAETDHRIVQLHLK